ncbi:MAG TPA: hypothetical protein VN132_05540 [Bdellovibrio sp.]|nr:hypothetical protein [Bdellovibrio sp.]
MRFSIFALVCSLVFLGCVHNEVRDETPGSSQTRNPSSANSYKKVVPIRVRLESDSEMRDASLSLQVTESSDGKEARVVNAGIAGTIGAIVGLGRYSVEGHTIFEPTLCKELGYNDGVSNGVDEASKSTLLTFIPDRKYFWGNKQDSPESRVRYALRAVRCCKEKCYEVGGE